MGSPHPKELVMDLIEALRTRRSTKNFSARPVSRESLLELVDIAHYSPSGGNKNPWRFVVVTKRETLGQLSQAHPNCRWLATAQAGIAIVVDPVSTRYWLEDSCIAAYSIWLAAIGRGLGVAWSALYQGDNAQESERRQAFVREVLCIPQKLNVPVVLGVGYPQITPAPRKLRTLEEILSWESYPVIKDA